MKMRKTSSFLFNAPPLVVWNAVTSGNEENNFAFATMTDEEYAARRAETLEKGEVMARVVDMTPGKSCGYTLESKQFDMNWSATFEARDKKRTRMVLTEEYDFHSLGQYLLGRLFLNQGRRQREYFQEIANKISRT